MDLLERAYDRGYGGSRVSHEDPAGVLSPTDGGSQRIWLHATKMPRFWRDPVVVDGGDGIYLHTVDGRSLLDAISAAMVTGLGYSNAAVRDAMSEQLDRLAFWPVLHGTSDVALRLVEKLNEVLPGDLGNVFLLNGGSEATETALKMARQYQQLVGRPRKTKVVARYGGYHGATMGALSVSGLRDRSVFAPLVPDVIHALPPDAYRCPMGCENSVCDLTCLSVIESVIAAEGRETVAAVIVDPVMAAAGMIVPPQNYYRRLQELCGEDILLIFDEVLTGFGRTGHWFAADYYGVVPDIVCLGKGISAGYSPLAAAVARPYIADAFDGADAIFQHIHTSGGNPLAAVAGLATIEQIETLGLVARARASGQRLIDGLRALQERTPAIGDVRGLGLLVGFELVSDRQRRIPFEEPVAPRIVAHALRHEDMLVRCSRDVVQMAPPLISSDDEIDEMLARIERSVHAVTRPASEVLA